MRTPLSIGIVLVLGLLALWGMRRGWLRRETTSAAWVPDLPPVPADADLGVPRSEPFTATYVSSTRAGDYLDRIVAHDLGVRSAAVVQVFDAGIRITRIGASDVLVPAASLRAVGTTNGIAGKFVGRDGIVVLTWLAGPADERDIDTGLHLRNSADRPRLLAAATTLIAEPPSPTAHAATKEHS